MSRPDRSEDGLTNGRAAAAPAPAALGRTVGRGMAFSLASTLFQRGASLAAQWILGLLLAPEEFGIVAVATSIAMVAQVFQDGGIRWLLVQRAGEYRSLAGPLFWLATAINLVLALLLCAASPLAAIIYGDQRIAWNLLVVALSVAMTSPMSVLNARLSIDLRFGRLALIQMGSTVIRYGASIGFALLDLGALSLVLPLPLIAAYEGLMGFLVTREAPWRSRAETARWRGFLRQVGWVLGYTLSNGLVNLGPYMAAGAFVAAEVVGFYYFGYMIVAQLGSTLANNLHSVLFPTMQKMADQRGRLRDAALRSIGVLMLVAAPSCLVLAPSYRWIEALLWGGRWAASDPVVRMVAASFPFYAVLHVITASMVSRGEFKRAALLTGALGAVMMAGVAAGAAWFGSAGAIAAFGSVWLGLGSAVYVLIEARRLGAAPRQIGGAMLPSWLVAVGAAVVVTGVEPRVEAIARRVLEGRWLALAMTAALVGLFGVVYAIGARLLVSRTIRDALTVVPQRVARVARACMLMREHQEPRAE